MSDSSENESSIRSACDSDGDAVFPYIRAVGQQKALTPKTSSRRCLGLTLRDHHESATRRFRLGALDLALDGDAVGEGNLSKINSQLLAVIASNRHILQPCPPRLHIMDFGSNR